MRNLYAMLVFSNLLGLGCGTGNIYKEAEKEEAAEDAAIELENGNPEKAIEILLAALKSNSDDFSLVSMLSTAYAQRGGVSLIDLALNMAENPENSSSSQNEMAVLWPILPEAEQGNIDDLHEGVTLLESIPADSRTSADGFKLAILSTALASLQLKALDLNGDCELSTAELLNLSIGSASTVMSAIQGASSALSTIGEGGASTEAAAEQVQKITTAISNSPGDDDAAKIRNYFSNSAE